MTPDRSAVAGVPGDQPDHIAGMVRAFAPALGGLVVLVALWPAVCVSGDDAAGGATTCHSAVLLPLPWGESADTWGMVVPIAAALLVGAVVRRVLR